MSQALEALAKANEVRIAGAGERKALIGANREEVTAALVNPNPGLASYRLGKLFARSSHGNPIRRIGPRRLERAFQKLAHAHPRRRQNWSPELRLRDLSELERQRLVEALYEVGGSA